MILLYSHIDLQTIMYYIKVYNFNYHIKANKMTWSRSELSCFFNENIW